MARAETSVKPIEIDPEEERQAMELIRDWANEHTDDLVTLLPYEPDLYPHQKLEIVHIPANATPENLEMAANLARAAMNESNYERLVNGYRNGRALSTILTRLHAGQNTLVVTGHVTDTLDTAISHSTLTAAVAPEERESFARRNVVIANHIMKFMAIGGYPVTEILSWSGTVLMGMPPLGARHHDVSRDVVRADVQHVEPVFDSMLDEGVVMHRSLTGTRAKDIVLADGRPAKYLPLLDKRIHKTILERSNCAVPVPMIVKYGNTRGDVYDPRNLYTPEDIEYLMKKLVEELCDYSDVPIFYGKPEGAEELNKDKDLVHFVDAGKDAPV